LAETYVRPGAAEIKERDAALVKAEEIFQGLGKGRLNTKTAWVGLAWRGECEYARDRRKDAEEQFDRVLKATTAAADDGKRMVRFFQVRHAALDAFADSAPAKLQQAEKLCRDWLRTPGYDSPRKPSPEALTVRFLLGIDLQLQAQASLGPRPKNP